MSPISPFSSPSLRCITPIRRCTRLRTNPTMRVSCDRWPATLLIRVCFLFVQPELRLVVCSLLCSFGSRRQSWIVRF